MSTRLRDDPGQHMCGMSRWHPAWMQRYATSKMFMAVYGLLGTIQATSYMYFIVTLTTIEKRFKIPSETTGIILSGNEISQILLSLILSYVGGQRNRPRWIAWGIAFCGLSCFILALPHFIYGAGDDVLQLTKEYFNNPDDAGNETASSLALVRSPLKRNQQLCGSQEVDQKCDTLFSIVPLVLVFLSQFVFGIGNTLYYSLGQTYLDDNTKKTNTPLMLAVAISLRMIGPIMGFFLGYISLNMFIDFSKSPLVDSKDPRWLGAWWFGWIVLGTLMVLFSGLIGLFPKHLPKQRSPKYNSHLPQVLRQEDLQLKESLPLGSAFSSTATLDVSVAATTDLPKLRDFPRALMRLLRNKLLIFNIISGVFYLLGATALITFLSKYMEVQFHKSAHTATIVVGPVSIIGMIVGVIGSGVVISKMRPNPSKVLMWNVIVGCVYIAGQISYMFLYCGDSVSVLVDGKLNIDAQCNSNCSCDGVPYSPICHESSRTTYFSPCHAGCHTWNAKEKVYTDCSCLDQSSSTYPSPRSTSIPSSTHYNSQTLYTTSPEEEPNMPSATTTHPFTDVSTHFLTEGTTKSVLERKGRSFEAFAGYLKPGVCLQDCNMSFWTFAITSMIVNWLGSSGRIGNLLVNYRAVSKEDKSFAQGLSLMLLSLFALIPGPILFGRIIDSTCLVWTKTCSGKGNCQLYDQTSFRYLVNGVAFSLTTFGVIFDILVWYYGRHLDLYGEREAIRLEELRRKTKAITPLLAKK